MQYFGRNTPCRYIVGVEMVDNIYFDRLSKPLGCSWSALKSWWIDRPIRYGYKTWGAMPTILFKEPIVQTNILVRGLCGLVLLGVAGGMALGQDKAKPDANPAAAPKAPSSERPKRMPPRLMPPGIDGPTAGAKAIEMFDTNKDGVISGAELDKCPGLKAARMKIDVDDQGEITADMIARRIKAWQDSKLGRMSTSVTVLHNGKPLAGALVRFVPETFLGENIKPANGTTDKNGVAMISIELSGPGEPPGVAPGLYRIEITKDGENIPVNYNIDTTLGQEIALDAAGIQDGIKFNLNY